MNTAKEIVNKAEEVAVKTGWSLATISDYAVNDANVIAKLKAGGTCTLRTADKFMTFLKEYENYDADESSKEQG